MKINRLLDSGLGSATSSSCTTDCFSIPYIWPIYSEYRQYLLPKYRDSISLDTERHRQRLVNVYIKYLHSHSDKVSSVLKKIL